MDANGARFHLISGPEDWLSVADTSPLGDTGAWYAPERDRIGLKPQVRIFARGKQALPLAAEDRRGAACDRFGSWYWISNDRKCLYRSPAGTKQAVLYWDPRWVRDGRPGPPPEVRVRPARRRETFVPQLPGATPGDLCGLAVTTHHYLVVGCLDPAGLLIFDLHSGGEPLRIGFPAGATVEPFDLAAAPDGGLWVLDRAHHRLWGLDRSFRLLPLAEALPSVPEPGSFQPDVPGAEPVGPPAAELPQGLELPDLGPSAVEALPDRSVLVLVRPAAAGGSSQLLHYRSGSAPGILVPPAAPLPLPDLDDVTAEEEARPVVGHDMAFSPSDNLLYVVEQDGNQAIAYWLDLPQEPGKHLAATPQATYLPMHYFGGRALAYGVTGTGEPAIFYDVTPRMDQDRLVRWSRLHAIDEPRYTRLAWLEVGQPGLDSHQRGTTWHRLFLDACIPPEAEVQVWTRANDDPELLPFQAYRQEPPLYLRGRGAEIPYWEETGRSAGRRGLDEEEAGLAAHTGSWEVLLQSALGRYLQVRLVLTGNGRASPQIRRMRVYYPRFSYLKEYLPAAYSQDRESAHFFERFLANMEGWYTDLEGKIGAASALFDPRSAPPETLEWLAAWVGMVLDPLWSKVGGYDRRRLMIRFARRLYERRGTPQGIRFAVLLLLDPCLESTLRRLERAAVHPDLALRQELERLDLPYPGPGTGEEELEDLLYHYVLRAPGRDRVRIVEHWQARQGLALQYGDVTQDSLEGVDTTSLETALASAAHRFAVLVPEDLTAEYAAMVEKIVGMEKPAHTEVELRRFWDFFLVGQARLGTDTVLGEDSRFLPIILGRDYLSEGYLSYVPPVDLLPSNERSVSDRDRIGDIRL